VSRTEKRKLARLIEQATVDAYDESEQAAGFLTIMQDNMRTGWHRKGAVNIL